MLLHTGVEPKPATGAHILFAFCLFDRSRACGVKIGGVLEIWRLCKVTPGRHYVSMTIPDQFVKDGARDNSVIPATAHAS